MYEMYRLLGILSIKSFPLSPISPLPLFSQNFPSLESYSPEGLDRVIVHAGAGLDLEDEFGIVHKDMIWGV